MTELSMKDEQEKEPLSPIRLAEIDAQQKIMARVDELMSEAAQTRRSTSDGTNRPFWAQSTIDIPPSEQFGKLRQMTEEEPPKSEQEDNTAASQAAPAAPARQAEADTGEAIALSAIRDEVINKMSAQPAALPSAEIEALHARIEAMESRIDKHQQDLTALLKLVRQLAAKKEEEKTEPKKSKKSESSGWGFGLLVTILLVGGIIGWLFWMDPAFMMEMMSNLVHEGLAMAIQLLAQLGAV
ncbi:MAG: hypothetical protein ACPG6Y_05905 [Candidatus Puniceispirillaceae bacterium]